jgi:hypothetical protein
VDWHSKLWGRAEERPLTRTVVVTVDAYNELQENLKNIPPEEPGQVIQVKRDMLNSLPTYTTPTVDPDVVVDEEDEEDEITYIDDADLTLPMRITYVDLTDLKPCPYIPQLVLYRPEFDELTEYIEEYDKEEGDKARYKFITGTPGIGVSLRCFKPDFTNKLLQERRSTCISCLPRCCLKQSLSCIRSTMAGFSILIAEESPRWATRCILSVWHHLHVSSSIAMAGRTASRSHILRSSTSQTAKSF